MVMNVMLYALLAVMIAGVLVMAGFLVGAVAAIWRAVLSIIKGR